MQLTIIIVNFRTPGLIIDCLRSVYDQPGGSFFEFEVIVVDNNSDDNSQELIRGNFPQVRWMQMNANSGFARANNRGIREAKGDIVLLLNPDTINLNNAIEKCFDLFLKAEYIACGIQLLNPDGSPQISGNYFMKGGLNHLMSLPYVGKLLRWLGYQFKIKKTNVAMAEGTVEVDWINGAFLMVKKTAIEKAGLLDEDFFLYSEEIEWCSRLKRAGKLCIYGDLHVVHLQGESANKEFGTAGKGYRNLSDKRGLQIMLSGLVRIRKQFGIGWFLFHLLVHLFTIPVFFIIAILRTVFLFPERRSEWKGWWGFSLNVFRVCGDFFRIMRNKPYFYKVL